MCGARCAVLAGILRHHIYEHLHPHVSWQRPFVEHVLSMRQMFFSKTEVSHSSDGNPVCLRQNRKSSIKEATYH